MALMTLRRARLLALVGSFALVAASVAVTIAALRTQQDDARVINLAGRQRMLIQKMILEAQGFQSGPGPTYRADLDDTAYVYFEQTLNALITGGEAPYTDGATVVLPPTHDPATLAQLTKVSSLWWNQIDPAIHVLLRDDPHDAASAQAAATIESLSPVLLLEMDKAVRLYEAEAERKVARAQSIQVGFLAIAAALVVVTFLLTERWVLVPIARLGAAARRMGEGDLDTPVSVVGLGEIDDLARSFDDMRQSLAASQVEQARLYTYAWERLERITALHDIDAAITSYLSMEETLDTLLEKVMERLRVDAAAVALVTSETGELNYAARRGLDGEFFKDGLLRVNEGIAGLVAHNSKPVAIVDVRGEPRFVRRSIAEQLGIVSYLAVPLRARGETLGVLELATREQHTFFPEEVDFFVTLAGQAAIVIENTRMFEEARRRATQQRTLAESAGAILARLDAGALWPAVTTAIWQTLAADRAAIYLYDPATDRLTCPYAFGLSSEYITVLNRHFRDVPGSRLLSDPRPITIADAQTDPTTAPFRDLIIREGFHSYAVFSLAAPGLAPGALVAYRNLVAPFTPDDIATGQTLAHIVAVALQNVRLFAQAQARREELEFLYHATLAVSTAVDLNMALAQAVALLADELKYPHVAIALVDETGEKIELRAQHGIPVKQWGPAGQGIRLGQGLVGWVVQHGQPLLVNDVSRDPRYVAGIPETRSELVVPLHIGERVIGAINAESTHLDAFTEADQRLLTTLAGQLATAIDQLRAEAAERQRSHELAAVARVSSALRGAPTRANMLPVILDQLLELLKAESAALAMRDPVSGETVIEVTRGTITLGADGLRLPASVGIAGQVIAAGQPYLSSNLQADSRFAPPDLLNDRRAAACIPLATQEQIIGALWVTRENDFGSEEVRLLTAIADMTANALYRAALHEQTEQRLQRLTALRAIDSAISSSLDLHVTLNVVLDQITTQLHLDAADVLLLNPHTKMLEYAAGRGFRSPGITHTRLGEGNAGRAALERRIVHIANLPEAKPFGQRTKLLSSDEAFIMYYAAPLIAKSEVKGVLEIFHRARLKPDAEWLGFLEALATQAAIAIDNAELFDRLQRSNAELALAYDATIEGWSRALDLRDKETEGHTQRVTEMTLRLARAMGIGDAELMHIRWGALLHDIGKMGIPDSILLKPGPLTDAEWAIMRLHPRYADQMLAPIAYLHPALDIPYCHHEKWDGTGYPRGLMGEKIPLAARIFAVVDEWDALCSDRPYRKAWPEEKVREHIRSLAGTHFDPQIVDRFLKLEENGE